MFCQIEFFSFAVRQYALNIPNLERILLIVDFAIFVNVGMELEDIFFSTSEYVQTVNKNLQSMMKITFYLNIYICEFSIPVTRLADNQLCVDLKISF